MRISDWSSDVCSSDLVAVQDVARILDDLGRLPAGGVGNAEPHAVAPHPGHPAVADERLRRRQPLEVDSLVLGVGHLALRAGHVGAVAAVQAGDRDRALAQRRAYRSEEHTSELQSLMRTSYAVFC